MRHGFDSWVEKIPWRREWQPTPVFLPGESQGQRSLEGYDPWGHKESDTAEQLSMRGICPLEENKWWEKVPSVPPQLNLKINTEGARSDSDPSTSWSQKAKVSSCLKGQNGQYVKKWSQEFSDRRDSLVWSGELNREPRTAEERMGEMGGGEDGFQKQINTLAGAHISRFL